MDAYTQLMQEEAAKVDPEVRAAIAKWAVEERIFNGAKEKKPEEPVEGGRHVGPDRDPRWWSRLLSFVDGPMPGLTGAQVTVWLYLFRYSHNGRAQETLDQIASGTGYSRKHVTASLAALMDAGVLRRLKRGNIRYGGNVYQLETPAPPETPIEAV
ncbi:MAG: replication/maintenance protein RepL [Acidimicrobiia bacterium]|nr:replication/maintenance protein RepL [Acidimicrobiia bacterium]